MIERVADAVVARLAGAIPDMKVEHFPDVPARFNFTAARESLLVGYEGSTYDDLASFDPYSSTRTVTLSVTAIVRSLRGSLGAMSVLEQVRTALFGWRPTLPDPVTAAPTPLGFTPLRPTREGFVSEDQGVWRFVISFETATVAVADTAPLAGVPFQSLELKDAS